MHFETHLLQVVILLFFCHAGSVKRTLSEEERVIGNHPGRLNVAAVEGRETRGNDVGCDPSTFTHQRAYPCTPSPSSPSRRLPQSIGGSPTLRPNLSIGGQPTKQSISIVSGPFQTPLVGAAAAQLPDGRIVLWSAYSRNKYRNTNLSDLGKTITAIFDPATGESVEEEVVDTQHDMFCPGTATLSDGRIMITGGSSAKRVTIYDPANNSWSIDSEMQIARGYHSMAPLSDGSVFTHGGSWSGNRTLQGRKDAEIWSEASSWTLLPGIEDGPFLTNDTQGRYRSDNHMWLYEAPNKRIFHAGPSKQMHWIDVEGSGAVFEAGLRGDDEDAMNGNAVMFDIGLILTTGGSLNYNSGNSSKRAYVIDINGNDTSVQRVGDMEYGRTFQSSIVLPSGEVVVVGGQDTVELFEDLWAVYAVEMWSPSTGEFTKLSSDITIPRHYHSAGLLLKDGRVLVTGGGLCGRCSGNHADAEIITPPYLLDNDGNPALRPVIEYAPSEFTHGIQFDVAMDSDSSHTFALIRLGSATHAINNDQRRIPLDVVESSNGTFTLLAPHNPSVVLPGSYYLFAMNALGVPSVGVDMMRTAPTNV